MRILLASLALSGCITIDYPPAVYLICGQAEDGAMICHVQAAEVVEE